MADKGTNLPSFAKPPVNEVVIAVAFARPPGLTTAHLGVFWGQHLRSELPIIEERPPYEPPVEDLGMPAPPTLNFEVLEAPPAPRLWATSGDSRALLQMQPDWLAYNWRDAAEGGEPYPRWPAIEARFKQHFDRFRGFLGDEDLGDLDVLQCEVTYVNRITSGAAWQTHGDLHKVLSIVDAPSGFLPPAEVTQLATAFRMADDSGDRGRLHVTVQPAFRRADRAPVVTLNLTARGAPASSDENDVLSFLRLSHEWIVQAFVALTTPAMHEEWGLNG